MSVSKPRVHLQEACWVYSYGTVRFTHPSISSLPPTKLPILMCVKRTVSYCNCMYSRLPEDEPLGSKHAEDFKNVKIKILI